MKRVTVTDPCYLISNSDWDKLIKESEGKAGQDWITVFDETVTRFLISISGDSQAVAGDTGCGDWVNEIDGAEFGADSGMVCVVEYTSNLRKYIKDNYIKDNKNPILPDLTPLILVDDDATYEIDKSNPHWSVVKIHSGNETIESLPPEE